MAKIKKPGPTLTPEVEGLISKQTECIEQQIEQIATLESENQFLKGEIEVLKGGLANAGIDAIAFLRSVYSGGDAPLGYKIQCAVAVAKTCAMPRTQINVGFSLYERLEAQRQIKRQARTIGHQPDPAA
jgi:hypothetical protein